MRFIAWIYPRAVPGEDHRIDDNVPDEGPALICNHVSTPTADPEGAYRGRHAS
jgi:hypothetical protein